MYFKRTIAKEKLFRSECSFYFVVVSDSVQNREPGLKECDDTSDVGKRRKDSTGSGGTMGVLRRAYRCISSGAIPIAPVNEQSAATVPAEAADHAGRDDSSSSSSYYHSYSCDDLYLAADDNGGDPRGGDGQLHGHQHSAGPEVRWSVRSERHDEVLFPLGLRFLLELNCSRCACIALATGFSRRSKDALCRRENRCETLAKPRVNPSQILHGGENASVSVQAFSLALFAGKHLRTT